MQKHPQIGYWILEGIEALHPASTIVLTHHERFDGTGYPRGLSRGSIPQGARIFSVMDTLDSMTSDRPYRRALTYEAARQEIVRCSGTQFDPEVVSHFLRVPQEVWDQIRSNTATKSRNSLSGGPTPFTEFLSSPQARTSTQ